MNIRHILTSVFLAGAAAAGSANAVVVFSEDFEAWLPYVAPGNFLTVPASGPSLGLVPLGIHDWFATGSIDFIREATAAAHTFGAIDSVSVDLSGSPGPGQISRTFTAIAGLTYLLDWQYFRNGSGTNLEVNLGGTNASFGAPLNISNGHLTWTAVASGSQVLSFGGGAGDFGPTIDNIVLSAVPEPGPVALMLMGLGVVGFLARSRLRNA